MIFAFCLSSRDYQEEALRSIIFRERMTLQTCWKTRVGRNGRSRRQHRILLVSIILLVLARMEYCCRTFAFGFVSTYRISLCGGRHYWYSRRSSGEAVSSTSSSSTSLLLDSTSMVRTSVQHPQQHLPSANSIPIRTENGGYLHTEESKKKISLANKGRVPWNKGRSRSEEEKARIASGVRERNRLRLLEEASAKNMTVEQYVQDRDAEKLQKIELRQGRKTDAGGYLLTEETKQKISQTLKDRWKMGQVKRRDASTYARGKTGVARHTTETKQRISASLKAKWENDEQYREYMTERAQYNEHDSRTIRQRISQTLKERWKDPEFRSKMLEQMKNRKSQLGKLTPVEHRQKIAQTMREKWQDPTYRQKALEGMAKRRGLTVEQFLATKDRSRSRSNNNSRTAARPLVMLKPIKPKKPKMKRVGETNTYSDIDDHDTTKAARRKTSTTRNKITFNWDPIVTDSSNVVLRVVTPIDIVTTTSNSSDSLVIETESNQNSSVGVTPSIPSTSSNQGNADDIQAGSITTTTTKTHTPSRRKRSTEAGITKKSKTKRSTTVQSKDDTNNDDEQRLRLREENRKLYKLLYDDEEQDSFLMNEVSSTSKVMKSTASNTLSSIFLNDNDDDDDFDLDSYDPYGLDKLAQNRPPQPPDDGI